MSNLKLILTNVADEAVLTAVPAEVPTLPVTMLQDERRGRAMRSTGTAQTINGNLNQMETIDGCVLSRHNFTDLAVIRIKLYDGENQTGSLMYDTQDVLYGDLIPAGEFVAGIDPFGGAYHTPPIAILWFAQQVVRSFEITITDTNNPNGYLQIGRLIMGRSISPEHNFSWGAKLDFVDRSARSRTAAGGLRTRRQERYRRLTVPLDHMTDADRNRFSSELRNANGRDVLVSAYPDETGLRLSDYTMVAQVVNGVSFTHMGHDSYTMPLVFEDV